MLHALHSTVAALNNLISHLPLKGESCMTSTHTYEKQTGFTGKASQVTVIQLSHETAET